MQRDKKERNYLKVLRKYFSGEESEDGEKIYQEWFDSFDDNKGAFDELENDKLKAHKDIVYQSVKDELNRKALRKPLPLYHLRREKKQKSAIFRLVAVLIAGSLLSLGVMHYTGMFLPNHAVVNVIEKSNPSGQISEFKLPDGSSVWLNADSRLSFPEKFSEESREITLQGEAFFDVVRDTSKPFIVRTGSLSTRVLGTSFNVKAYPEDQVQEVTLISGEVEVSEQKGKDVQILKPDQKVQYEDQKGLQEPVKTEALLAKAWTQRELVFLRENFGTVAKTFERWYGVEFVFEDEELRDEIFVYHFKDLSLKNSMIILKELADFDFEITNNKVIIKKSL